MESLFEYEFVLSNGRKKVVKRSSKQILAKPKVCPSFIHNLHKTKKAAFISRMWLLLFKKERLIFAYLWSKPDGKSRVDPLPILCFPLNRRATR